MSGANDTAGSQNETARQSENSTGRLCEAVSVWSGQRKVYEKRSETATVRREIHVPARRFHRSPIGSPASQRRRGEEPRRLGMLVTWRTAPGQTGPRQPPRGRSLRSGKSTETPGTVRTLTTRRDTRRRHATGSTPSRLHVGLYIIRLVSPSMYGRSRARSPTCPDKGGGYIYQRKTKEKSAGYIYQQGSGRWSRTMSGGRESARTAKLR